MGKSKGKSFSSSIGDERKVKSYKDHLMGIIPGAYEKAFFEEKAKIEMRDQIHNKKTWRK